MKIDMHCHISSGSVDSFVSLKKTVQLLKSKGFHGMLITDHNSYKAYNTYKKLKEKVNHPKLNRLLTDFSVLLGVEYDTSDAGHTIIVLPDNILIDKRFEKRGMTIESVISYVTELGGIVGLAHPFAHGRFGASWYINAITSDNDDVMPNYYLNVIKKVDFIEGFNGTIPIKANIMAKDLCTSYNKVCTAGSDSHRSSTVGLCGTVFKREIKTNNDLIQAIKDREIDTIEEGYSKLAKSVIFRKLFNICECMYYWSVRLKLKVTSIPSHLVLKVVNHKEGVQK